MNGHDASHRKLFLAMIEASAAAAVDAESAAALDVDDDGCPLTQGDPTTRPRPGLRLPRVRPPLFGSPPPRRSLPPPRDGAVASPPSVLGTVWVQGFVTALLPEAAPVRRRVAPATVGRRVRSRVAGHGEDDGCFVGSSDGSSDDPVGSGDSGDGAASLDSRRVWDAFALDDGTAAVDVACAPSSPLEAPLDACAAARPLRRAEFRCSGGRMDAALSSCAAGGALWAPPLPPHSGGVGVGAYVAVLGRVVLVRWPASDDDGCDAGVVSADELGTPRPSRTPATVTVRIEATDVRVLWPAPGTSGGADDAAGGPPTVGALGAEAGWVAHVMDSWLAASGSRQSSTVSSPRSHVEVQSQET